MTKSNLDTQSAEAPTENIPEEVAILPLKGGVAYPNAVMPINIGQERSIKLIDDALVKDKTIGIVSVKNSEAEVPNQEDLYSIGCLVTIVKMMKLPDDHMSVLVQGQSRIRVGEYTQTEPYLRAKIEVIDEAVEKDVETEAQMVSIKRLLSFLPIFPLRWE